MLVDAIDHVQLAMPPEGEAQARTFYSGVLGIPEVPKPQALSERSGCWFESGALRVHLGVESGFRAARKAHPAFVTPDFDALVRALHDTGCECKGAESLHGRRRAFTHDPFGNRIELIEAAVSA
ncbi:MAG: VOC family protein [Rhodanobacteraceae bacterium]